MFNTIEFVAAAMIASGLAFSGPIAAAQGTSSPVKPISIGISGGASIATGELANGTSSGFSGVNTGYNVTGSLAIDLPVVPFGLRADVAYNGFGTRNATFPAGSAPGTGYNADVRVLGVSANVVFPLHLPAPVLEPYLIGGVGEYNVRLAPTTGGSTSQSNVGFNIGAGVKLPLVLFSAFVEARYNRVNQSNGSVAFVPITVGVMF